MNLLNLSDRDKIEAFNMVVKAYEKDGDMLQFGYDVQEVLILFQETSEFSK